MPTSAPKPAPAPPIVASGIGLVVDGARILDDISISLGSGERWVVLGPNGSGKTSLVRLFSGYAYPSEGTLQVLGERFGRTDLRLLRARIGWVHSDVRYQIVGGCGSSRLHRPSIRLSATPSCKRSIHSSTCGPHTAFRFVPAGN